MECLPRAYVRLPGAGNSQWFETEIQSKTVDEIILESLDEQVEWQAPAWVDPAPVRWLNRFYGAEFDEVLAREAPEALAFRNREIGRGYDPVSLVTRYLLFDPGKMKCDARLLREIYPDASDRDAMEKLLRVLSSPEPAGADNWHQDLISWYKANRSSLVYDPAKRRFVVKASVVNAPEVESTGTR